MSTTTNSLSQGDVPQTNFKNEKDLPPTKIKRSYKCTECIHSTWNPRDHLRHRILVHGHKIKVVECPLCLYACQYRQKLSRHLRLVHKVKVRADSSIGPLDPEPLSDSANNSIIDYNNNNLSISSSINNNYNNEYSDNKNYDQIINDITVQLNSAMSQSIAPIAGDCNQPIDLVFPLPYKILLNSVHQLIDSAIVQQTHSQQ